ncbi:AraC family transcriptional regulator [Paenibacillus nasutitermitis]|uniref:AraC family transcriptional regulator n=1 Tax=Paenibacillus nasutitermitis TaxID=1652958 RepID=A0A917E1H9_9BACL|nr:AraC family transcriptional regulator [Paenibacillus nasutitermitis]GGD89306.1 AraC family transcriptional regulator [Paenibacillus nasutitermitis]
MEASKKNEPFEGKRFPFRMIIQKSYPDLVKPHWHEHLEFVKVLSGRVQVYIDNHVFIAEESDIIFINSCQIHSIRCLSGEDCAIQGMIFDKFLLSGAFEDPESRYIFSHFMNSRRIWNPLTLSTLHRRVLDNALTEAYEEYTHQVIGYELSIKACLYRMITPIFRQYKQETFRELDLRRTIESSLRLKPALDYIEVNYGRKIYTGAICSSINMSPYHFTRYFKKITGVTPVQYINQYRVDMAKRLLLEQDISITEIAERTGFCNINYFDKMFKKLTELTPIEYRNQFFHSYKSSEALK